MSLYDELLAVKNRIEQSACPEQDCKEQDDDLLERLKAKKSEQSDRMKEKNDNERDNMGQR